MKILLTVVIPYYKGEDSISMCLTSLKKCFKENNFEVVIVNDGSKENLEEITKNLSLPYDLRIFNQKHLGQSAATNFGIKEARGKYVLLFAQDMAADENLIKEHLKIHQENNDPSMAVLGFMPFYPDIGQNDFLEFLLTGPQFDFLTIKDKQEIDPAKYFYAPNVSLEKEFLIKNGLFDEELTYGFQDLELGLRLKSKGLKLIFNKSAVAYHYHSITLDQFCKKQEIIGKSAAVLVAKYPHMFSKKQIDYLKKLYDKKQLAQSCRAAIDKMTSLGESALEDEEVKKFSSLFAKGSGSAKELKFILYRIICAHHYSKGFFD